MDILAANPELVKRLRPPPPRRGSALYGRHRTPRVPLTSENGRSSGPMYISATAERARSLRVCLSLNAAPGPAGREREELCHEYVRRCPVIGARKAQVAGSGAPAPSAAAAGWDFVSVSPAEALRRRGLFFQAVDAARDPGLHHVFAEVQQVAEFAAGESQVRLDLLLVCRGHPLH